MTNKNMLNTGVAVVVVVDRVDLSEIFLGKLATNFSFITTKPQP